MFLHPDRWQLHLRISLVPKSPGHWALHANELDRFRAATHILCEDDRWQRWLG